MLRKTACNGFCHSLLCSYSLLYFFLNFIFSVIFFCQKIFVTYHKKELLKWLLASDGLTSSALCRVCEGIQLSQITVPNPTFSRVVRDRSESETERAAKSFPLNAALWSSLCAQIDHQQPWDWQNKTEQVLAVPAKHFFILMDFRLILKFFQQHMFKLCVLSDTQFGL